jgi:hypothetical protein
MTIYIYRIVFDDNLQFIFSISIDKFLINHMTAQFHTLRHRKILIRVNILYSAQMVFYNLNIRLAF